MLGAAAARLDVSLSVVDPDASCPAGATADRHIRASFRDSEDLLGALDAGAPGTDEGAAGPSRFDLATVEIESVSTAALRTLRERGVVVHPSPEIIETIQDKLAQRRRLAAAGLPLPRFAGIGEAGTVEEAERDLAGLAAAAGISLPAVQKLRFGGYDGRGVALVEAASGSPRLPLSGPSMLEERIEVARELSVLVARTPEGALRAYPPVEMQMDPELHLLTAVLYPAGGSESTAREATQIATAAVAALGGAGIYAVELFVDPTGAVYINEIAPRPHNSGHLTIEAAETDQFEQHLRAILGLPLGSTAMRGAAAMVNLIGSGPEGPVHYRGLDKALSLPGVHLHLYGKGRSRPGRKMGHLTAVAEVPEAALERAREAASLLEITGREQ